MSPAVEEIQKEFEELVSQLEQLKSFNEITSENSSNAKKSINEIRSFVESVNVFKRTVESDYESKKEMFKKTEDKLNSSLKKIDIYVSGYKKELQKLGDNHKQTAAKIIEKNDKNCGDLITKYEAKLNEVKIKLENDFKSSALSYERKIENTLTEISGFKESVETGFEEYLEKSLEYNETFKKEIIAKITASEEAAKKRQINFMVLAGAGVIAFVLLSILF